MLIRKYPYSLLWSVCMLILFLLPKNLFGSDSIDSPIPFTDKIVHLVLFSIWALFFIAETRKNRVNSFMGLKRFGAVLIFGIVFGITIEGVQWLLPFGRSAQIWDLVADFIGLLVGMVISRFIGQKLLTNS